MQAVTQDNKCNNQSGKLHFILAGFAECMYGELDLITSAPLQRWDPELPNAPAEAGDAQQLVSASHMHEANH